MFAKCYFTVLTREDLTLFYSSSSLCSGPVPENTCFFGLRRNSVRHHLIQTQISHATVFECHVKRPLRLLDLRYFSYSDCVHVNPNFPGKLNETSVMDLFNCYTIDTCKLNTYEQLCEFFESNSENFSSLGIDGWLYVHDGIQVRIFHPESVITIGPGELVSEIDSWIDSCISEDDSEITLLQEQIQTFPDSGPERKCLSHGSTISQRKRAERIANIVTTNFVNSFLVM